MGVLKLSDEGLQSMRVVVALGQRAFNRAVGAVVFEAQIDFEAQWVFALRGARLGLLALQGFNSGQRVF